MRVESLADVSVGRSGLRIERAHAPITDSSDQHSDQHDQDDGDEMPVGKLLRYAIERHRRNRLNEDDAVEDKVPKGERTTKARYARRSGSRGFHRSGYWIMDEQKMSILKRFSIGEFPPQNRNAPEAPSCLSRQTSVV